MCFPLLVFDKFMFQTQFWSMRTKKGIYCIPPDWIVIKVRHETVHTHENALRALSSAYMAHQSAAGAVSGYANWSTPWSKWIFSSYMGWAKRLSWLDDHLMCAPLSRHPLWQTLRIITNVIWCGWKWFSPPHSHSVEEALLVSITINNDTLIKDSPLLYVKRWIFWAVRE